MSKRAGQYVRQPTGYYSYIPADLPPVPPLTIDDEMQALLSIADRKLGRLDGITQILPNPELFVAMYVNKEALLSSQIVGTQASLIDILDLDSNLDRPIHEVANYVVAMKYGLKCLEDFPLSLRLLREIHKKLLTGVRGNDKSPGEFRTSQNWIGHAGSTLNNAVFVPPAVKDMIGALNRLEAFFHSDIPMPSLVKIALIHAQFETIHPFLNGNGRIGRLLITFWLCHEQILTYPLLYLSYYFKKNREEYYKSLMNIRTNGEWEAWVIFFLKGVAETADESVETVKLIINLKDKNLAFLYEKKSKRNNYQRLLDLLFLHPIITKNMVSEKLNISHPTASTLVNEFVEFEILKDQSPTRERDKKYIFLEYVIIMQKGTEQ